MIENCQDNFQTKYLALLYVASFFPILILYFNTNKKYLDMKIVELELELVLQANNIKKLY